MNNISEDKIDFDFLFERGFIPTYVVGSGNTIYNKWGFELDIHANFVYCIAKIPRELIDKISKSIRIIGADQMPSIQYKWELLELEKLMEIDNTPIMSKMNIDELKKLLPPDYEYILDESKEYIKTEYQRSYSTAQGRYTIMKENGGVGDVWTWTAIDADSKFVVSWNVGNRDAETAKEFMQDVANRLANRVQLTTDGLAKYLKAVDNAFGNDIDFAQLIKAYGKSQEEVRYSPVECIGIEKKVVKGSPDQSKISTSYVERQNLTMRMGMRRFTRLTNAFSKKIENHCHAIALHFMYYNFVRIHKTLRVTPAMEVGITNKLWTIEDLVKLTDL